MSQQVWIALPTYNERDNLEPMVTSLLEVLPEAHVLVVDDRSPDGTGELADALAAADSRIHVLHRAGKEGLGAAYRAAFKLLLARGCDVIVQIDCDFSHDPRDVPRLLAALQDGSDLALGSRYVRGGGTPGWAIGRRLISRGGSLFAGIVLGLPAHDLTGGFKAWRAPLLRAVDLDEVGAQGYGFQVEMTWRAYRLGARVAEVPIVFGERRAGESKMSRRIVMEALWMVLRLRFGAASRPAAPASAGPSALAVGLRPVEGAGGVAVDDLNAVAIRVGEDPAGGGLAAHGTGKAEQRV